MPAVSGGKLSFREDADLFFFFVFYLVVCATTSHASWRQKTVLSLFGGIYLQQYI